mmetsp:Transcript_20564/g.55402  ORF Transcript_20564/g.55402 Transcript_20564/m.55402 type:complete len:312 (+) Transcript_20564:296-1231(+)
MACLCTPATWRARRRASSRPPRLRMEQQEALPPPPRMAARQGQRRPPHGSRPMLSSTRASTNGLSITLVAWTSAPRTTRSDSGASRARCTAWLGSLGGRVTKGTRSTSSRRPSRGCSAPWSSTRATLQPASGRVSSSARRAASRAPRRASSSPLSCARTSRQPWTSTQETRPRATSLAFGTTRWPLSPGPRPRWLPLSSPRRPAPPMTRRSATSSPRKRSSQASTRRTSSLSLRPSCARATRTKRAGGSMPRRRFPCSTRMTRRPMPRCSSSSAGRSPNVGASVLLLALRLRLRAAPPRPCPLSPVLVHMP